MHTHTLVRERHTTNAGANDADGAGAGERVESVRARAAALARRAGTLVLALFSQHREGNRA